VRRYLAMAPQKFTLYARNPARNIIIGNRGLAVVPGYGSAFIADERGRRRSATMQDFENFSKLACSSDIIDITGGLLVEPMDVALNLRPLEITQSLIRNSDKPFLGSVTGAEGARESIEMAKIVFDDISQKPCMVGLININSPLCLSTPMADAMVEYVREGQPVLLTPGILLGMTAPVTIVGALMQAFAELIGCVVITQALRPGTPVIIGLGGVGSDLRTGTTGFGRPEHALAIQLGAKIARQLNLPFRCTAAVTGARKPDCRSGYERMMTALTAQNAGVHFCLQAAGILDSINTMSYEQYVIDIEIWSYIKRFAEPVKVNDDTLAMDVVDLSNENYIWHEHTIKHMRSEIHIPSLVDCETYDAWWASNAKDVISKASQRAASLLATLKPPPLTQSIEKELGKYVLHRRQVLQNVS
jgi:trimethylamine--corrinoid protein Co-methyltransferase